jgi:hypothetical protein
MRSLDIYLDDKIDTAGLRGWVKAAVAQNALGKAKQ